MKVVFKEELELENYFDGMKASFFRKFFSTFLDLVYLLCINLPIFIFITYHKSSQNIIQTFKNFVKKNESIEAYRMLLFSIWMFFCCYLYFVFIPSKTRYQTFFSNNFGIRAVPIRDSVDWSNKPKQAALFRANLIPVFSLLFLNIVFFSFATVFNNSDWSSKVFSSSSSSKSSTNDVQWIPSMRVFAVIIFCLQFHHAITVGFSKKALNWFTKSNGLVYVNVKKANIMLSTEDKLIPDKNSSFNVSVPGINDLALKSLKHHKQNRELDEFDRLDFSEEIEV